MNLANPLTAWRGVSRRVERPPAPSRPSKTNVMGACVIVRPGETDYEHQGRVVGSLDLPLNARGEAETDDILIAVRTLAPKAVYTGSQQPALATAEAIAGDLGIALKVLDSLDNLDHGLWQGQLIDEIRSKQPKVFKRWQESPEDITPPNGETCEEATERVRSALKKPLKKSDPFLVVAPEPLATLVASVVRGGVPKLAGPTPQRPLGLVETVDRPVPTIVS